MYNVFVYIAGSMDDVIGLPSNWLFSRPHIPSPGRIPTRDPFHAQNRKMEATLRDHEEKDGVQGLGVAGLTGSALVL